MKKISNSILIFTLVALSMSPLIWFLGKGNAIIDGLDTNFPLEPVIWFTKRLFIWNGSYNAGSHFSSSVGGLFFHLVQVVPYLAGFSLQSVEIISILFWSTIIAVGAYLFAKNFISTKVTIIIPFLVLYFFNIYLYNSWENIKVANLGLVATLPLILTLLKKANEKEISNSKIIFFSAVCGVLAGGTGINPAYFISLFGVFFIYSLILLFTTKSPINTLFSIFKVFIPIVLVNLYWMLPLYNFVFVGSGISSLDSIGFTNWVDSLSQNTSIVNILRLQGVWDWYVVDPYGMPIYIPYALRYFRSLPFIIFSLVVPTLAFISLIVRSKQQYRQYVFFTILTIVGVFMGVGTHEPTGQLFKFFAEHIPFFNFFRSPWYIFTPYTIIGLAGLTSLLFNHIDEIITRKVKLSRRYPIFPLFILFFVFAHIVYSYPQVTGKIFRPGRPDTFYQQFPQYVFDAKDYLLKNDTGRIISIQEDPLETFDWGYKGTESLLGLFSDRQVLSASFNYSNRYFAELVNTFYRYVRREEYSSLISMSNILGFQTVFMREDAPSYFKPTPDVLKDYTKSVENIGKWSFVKLSDATVTSNVSIPSKVYVMNLSPEDYASISGILPRDSITLLKNDTQFESISHMLSEYGQILKAKNLDSDMLDNTSTYSFTIETPGEYSFVVNQKSLKGDNIKIVLDGQPIDVSNISIRDSSISIGPIMLQKGEHRALLISPQIQKTILNQEMPISLTSFDDKPNQISLDVDNFDMRRKYAFRFKYKYFYGDLATIQLGQVNNKQPFRVDKIPLKQSLDVEEQSYLYTPVELPSKLEFIATMPSSVNKSSKFEVSQIEAFPIYENDLFLIQSIKGIDTSQVKLTSNRVNPTKYVLNIQNVPNGYFVLLKENYHSGWIITSQSYIGGIQPHFSANGYANAWFIPVGGESAQIDVTFAPQKTYITALFASILSLVFISMYFLLDSYKAYRKH